MKKYLIGYKQADDSYVYVGSIDCKNITVTPLMDNAIDFTNKEHATSVCNYLNIDNTQFKVIEIEIIIKEVDNDVATSK